MAGLNDESTIQIPLSRGLYALADAKDAERLARYSWHAAPGPGGLVYAKTSVRDGDRRFDIKMHRFLMDAPASMMVDHINGDTLDNRKSNLRLCTQTENLRNARARRGAASKFKGVQFNSQANKWIAALRVEGRKLQIGTFTNEEDAARAYDAKALELFGEFARVNFPEPGQIGALLEAPVRVLGPTKTRPSCSLEGCDRPNDARGFCKLHYQRMKRNGDPHKVRPYSRKEVRA